MMNYHVKDVDKVSIIILIDQVQELHARNVHQIMITVFNARLLIHRLVLSVRMGILSTNQSCAKNVILTALNVFQKIFALDALQAGRYLKKNKKVSVSLVSILA